MERNEVDVYDLFCLYVCVFVCVCAFSDFLSEMSQKLDEQCKNNITLTDLISSDIRTP